MLRRMNIAQVRSRHTPYTRTLLATAGLLAAFLTLPVASHAQYDLVIRNGLIYERVSGESMLKMFERKPWMLFRYARIFAQLHTQMHEGVFEADVPALHGKLQYRIEHLDGLPAALRTSLLDALHSQPEADRVCHRRIPWRQRLAYLWRNLYEDCRYRVGPHEDRLQH